MVRFLVMELTPRIQVLNLALVVTFSFIYFRPSGVVHSEEGHVPVDYKGIYNDFVNLKMLCPLCIS